jgi:hypothetical protein
MQNSYNRIQNIVIQYNEHKMDLIVLTNIIQLVRMGIDRKGRE